MIHFVSCILEFQNSKKKLYLQALDLKTSKIYLMINVIDTFQHNKMMSQHDLVEFVLPL